MYLALQQESVTTVLGNSSTPVWQRSTAQVAASMMPFVVQHPHQAVG